MVNVKFPCKILINNSMKISSPPTLDQVKL